MKITIAIPAYKANFLKEAIESVVQQSYNDWELVIVNDHSPHDLTSIVEPFLCDDRIKYFINPKIVEQLMLWIIGIFVCNIPQVII